MSPLRFSESLASRLCHDLVAPIGAIQTGLELLSQTTPDHLTEFKEILNLILHSTETASARANFFRAAFGTSGNTLSFQEIKTITGNYLAPTKLNISWQDCTDPTFLKGWGRLFLNSILWLNECAPRGGKLEISFPQIDPLSILLHLKGQSLVFHKGTLEILQESPLPDDLTPRNIPCYLIRYLLEEKKATLSLTQDPSGNEIKGEIHALSCLSQ